MTGAHPGHGVSKNWKVLSAWGSREMCEKRHLLDLQYIVRWGGVSTNIERKGEIRKGKAGPVVWVGSARRQEVWTAGSTSPEAWDTVRPCLNGVCSAACAHER